MNIDDINNTNIAHERVLVTPAQFKSTMPISDKAQATVLAGRQTIQNILKHKDHRLLVVVGPCSIHDIKSAKEYALKLKKLHDDLSQDLYIVMRIYFEKPRTTIGWKGLINDPRLDGSFDVEEGLTKARELLLWLAELGLPAGTEALDPITPQYLSDLFSWSAIGARTTESQTHREMASGLSMPVGFKNGTDGTLSTAINALHSVSASHHFLGINQMGQVTQIRTKGNACGHIILRGGKKPNYGDADILACEKSLQQAKLSENIMVDCSHGNSSKKPELQPLVMQQLVSQIQAGNRSIIGLMIESHLFHGAQKIPEDLSQLKYGVSVTDACIDWNTTEKALTDMSEQLQHVLKTR
ncbi:MAG: 3-deoxy-7-phosphoheptulonate synthase [Pseudomonadota bacterium]